MKQFKTILSIALAGIAAGCLIAAVFLILKGKADDRRAEDIFNEHRVTVESSTGPAFSEQETSSTEESESISDDAASSEASTEAPQESSSEEAVEPVPNPYADSYTANADMAAWLKIPDTIIDYPVMWTPRDENYYLYRDFNGRDNQNGCLILDTDSSVDPLTTNLIIHGHNMKSGAMFGHLLDYEKQDFYENHKKIILYTPQCQRNYEVIAVFRSQVYKKTDEVFKFYQFFQADTEEEFNDFYNNIKKLSIYDTGVTAEFGDHFITLSTCVYHVTNGRLVVVAKEVESGEVYLPLTTE